MFCDFWRMFSAVVLGLSGDSPFTEDPPRNDPCTDPDPHPPGDGTGDPLSADDGLPDGEGRRNPLGGPNPLGNGSASPPAEGVVAGGRGGPV